MANIDLLKTELETRAASIEDDLDRLECLTDIDAWYTARSAYDTLTGTDVSSYSIGGRTVTRAQMPSLKAEVQDLYTRIMNKLYYRGAGLMDCRGTTGLDW